MEKHDSDDYFKRNPIKSEPFLMFRKHYRAARECQEQSIWTHNFVLVTVDENVLSLEYDYFSFLFSLQLQPHGRTVSMHTYDEEGFYFCTNYDGPKSTQMGIDRLT